MARKILQQNVPMCPKCSAMMHKRHCGEHLYFICGDCKEIWKVLGNGQAEIELIVTDNEFDALDIANDFYKQGMHDGIDMIRKHVELCKEEEVDDGK